MIINRKKMVELLIILEKLMVVVIDFGIIFFGYVFVLWNDYIKDLFKINGN